MEARTIIQVRIYVLVLNTFGRCEDVRIAAVSDEYQKLVDLYNSHLLPEGFRDEYGYYHSFDPNSPLSSLNPCPSLALNDITWTGCGIHDEWVLESEWIGIQNKYYTI